MTKPSELNKPVIKLIDCYLSDESILEIIGKFLENKAHKVEEGRIFVYKGVGRDMKGIYTRWEEEI